MNTLNCIVSTVSLSFLLVASGCGNAKESGRNVPVKKTTSESRLHTHHPAILKPLKTALDAGDVQVIDESIEFLDGGTFGFAVAYGSDVRYVMFPHPSRWTASQNSSTKTIILWNEKPSVSNGVDITQDNEFLQCLDSILAQSKVVRSVWRHECARVAFSGKMIWTQGGLLIVPETAKHFVSRFTQRQANSQQLKNSLKRQGKN